LARRGRYSPYGTRCFFTCVACCRNQRPSARAELNQSTRGRRCVSTLASLHVAYGGSAHHFRFFCCCGSTRWPRCRRARRGFWRVRRMACDEVHHGRPADRWYREIWYRSPMMSGLALGRHGDDNVGATAMAGSTSESSPEKPAAALGRENTDGAYCSFHRDLRCCRPGGLELAVRICRPRRRR